MRIREKIIEYINVNRVSTTEIADCLGKTGVLPELTPVNRGKLKVGKIKWVYAYDESNWDVHEQIRDTQKGDIVFIEAFNCKERAVVGELVSKYLLLYRQAGAIVTNARMRDAHRLIKEDYPIWCRGFSPVGCFNRKNGREFDQAVKEERMTSMDGAVMVCDDSGVVVIPKERLNEEFYERLIFIEKQEDTWFDCIDQRKWNTFDTVCLKRYENA